MRDLPATDSRKIARDLSMVQSVDSERRLIDPDFVGAPSGLLAVGQLVRCVRQGVGRIQPALSIG
jgi:hypothetical protein